jgi:hypothetical protein
VKYNPVAAEQGKNLQAAANSWLEEMKCRGMKQLARETV